MNIKYENDKRRMYMYGILSKQRKLLKCERKEFDALKKIRVWDKMERKVILERLLQHKYLSVPNTVCLVDERGVEHYGSSINELVLRVTELGEECLKKDLPSEYKKERHDKRMEWIDRLVDFKTIIFSILSATVGFLGRELISLSTEEYQWILQILV